MAKGKYAEWLTEDGLLLLRSWARNGLTDEEIARNMGIAAGTLYAWKNKHKEIDEALKKSKETYDAEVVEALQRATIGYYVTEKVWKNKWNPKSKQYELVLDQEKQVWIKPDTTAQIFWLKNRDKLHWRDRQDVGVEATGTEAMCIIPKREIIEDEAKGANK